MCIEVVLVEVDPTFVEVKKYIRKEMNVDDKKE